jgi:hypothetical protein
VGRIFVALVLGMFLMLPAPNVFAQCAMINLSGGRAVGDRIMVDDVSVMWLCYGLNLQAALSRDSVRLRDGSRGDFYMFDGQAGECVEITMRSGDFDTYLALRDGAPFGTLVAAADELDHDELLARIRAQLPRASTYFITASSSGSGEVLGAYTLDLQRC